MRIGVVLNITEVVSILDGGADEVREVMAECLIGAELTIERQVLLILPKQFHQLRIKHSNI